MFFSYQMRYDVFFYELCAFVVTYLLIYVFKYIHLSFALSDLLDKAVIAAEQRSISELEYE